LPGRCLCSQEEDGDHGKHSFDCPTTQHFQKYPPRLWTL
jgi:hypothetical protein